MKQIEQRAWQPDIQVGLSRREKSELPTERGNLSDEAFFTGLIEQYQPGMLRVAQRYVSSLESAQDIVAETWLAVLRGIETFEGRASLKTWLFAILLNRSRTRGKQERRLVAWESLVAAREEDEEPSILRTVSVAHNQICTYGAISSPEEQLIYQELHEWIEQAILALPSNLRRVMVLRDVEGWTAEETCSILGLSEVNQRVLLHRARRKVRDWLEALPIDR